MSALATPVEARPAATIALVRDHQGQVEVFLVRRHARSGFMANAYVFPGGRLDPADESPELLACLGSRVEELTGRMEAVASESKAQAHLVAAVRETFEEAGILLVTDSNGGPVSPERGWQDALNKGERSFESIVVGEGLRMDTRQVVKRRCCARVPARLLPDTFSTALLPFSY